MKSPLTRGEWIEIYNAPDNPDGITSPLTRGEWIEILRASQNKYLRKRLPSLEGSGLKFCICHFIYLSISVSPHSRGVD